VCLEFSVGKKVADVTAGQDGMTVLIPVINLLWRLVAIDSTYWPAIRNSILCLIKGSSPVIVR
jgi:hypothetical protein